MPRSMQQPEQRLIDVPMQVFFSFKGIDTLRSQVPQSLSAMPEMVCAVPDTG